MTSSNGNIFRVTGLSELPMNSPHKGRWGGASMFSLICAWTNGWANNRDAGDVGRHRIHYDVTVMMARDNFWHFVACVRGILIWCFDVCLNIDVCMHWRV